MKSFLGRLSQVTVLMAIAFLCSCTKPLTEEEQRKLDISHMGTEASLVGAFVANADHECRMISIPDINKCAQVDSPLLADRQAKMAAELAVAQVASYNKNCRDRFDSTYCDQLVNRAISIEMRKSKSPTSNNE